MMPPKKSKAARKAHEEPAADTDLPQEQTESKDEAEKQDDPSEPEDSAKVNIFQVEVVEGKRARNPPAGEQNLKEWLDEHVEDRDGQYIVILDAYEIYVSSCISKGSFAVSQYEFQKTIKEKFPNGNSIKESSEYKTLVRVKRAKKEKGEKSEKGSKVKADTFKIKMEDIVMRAIEEMGNPSKGVRFNTLKRHIAAKFPALQVDRRPKYLLAFLERSAKYGYIELVRGIGMCGFFRVPGPAKDEEEDKDAEDDGDEVKENGEKNEDEKDQVEDKEKSGDDNDDNQKKEDDEDKKEKDQEEKDQEEDGGKRKTRKAKQPPSGKSSKKKKSKRHAPKKTYRSFVVHGDPERIEDTFSLAMTYMVEPKEASSKKIQNYLNDYYVDDLPVDKFRKCLENGCEKGYWEQVTGQGMSGRFRLLMDEFDPTADDDLTGQIMNAIVACTEPKQCSAMLLKNYVMEYHPDFQIKEKPHLFKKALERAINKNQIIQLSGIGASGSFQMYDPFTPTPVILRGEDDEDDYESDPENNKNEVSNVKIRYGQFHPSMFQDSYQPRPTKRRGHGRQASKGLVDEPMANKVTKGSRSKSESKPARTPKSEAQKPKPKRKPAAKKKAEPVSDSEDSEEEENSEESSEEAPKKKRKKSMNRGKNTNRHSPRKQQQKNYADSSDEDSDPEYVSNSKKKSKSKKKKSSKKGGKQSPQKKRKAPVEQESSDDQDEGSDDDEPPPAKRGRAAPPPKKGGKQERRGSRRDEDDSDEETDEKSRSRSRASRGKYAEPETSDEEDADSEEELARAARNKGRSAPSKNKKSKKRKGRK